jgi:hypothetical protein
MKISTGERPTININQGPIPSNFDLLWFNFF